MAGRSRCPACSHSLAWRELIPLVSFLAQAGRCRHCRGKISRRYPAVEAATALLFAAGGLLLPDWPRLVLYLIIVSFFIALFVYDLEHYLVPDRISLPAIVVISVLQLFLGFPLLSLVWGAASGALWFLAQFLLSRGRWVGGGDIRLGLLMGVVLGWPLVWLALMLSYVGGSAAALLLIAIGKKTLKSRLPFATILLPATLAVWIWGGSWWRWYLGLLGF